MLNRYNKLVQRTILILLCVVIVTGCGKDPKNKYGFNKNSPVLVEIWHYYNGVQKIEFDKMVDEFNNTVGKEQGIIVEAFNQGSVGEITDKFLDTVNKEVGAGKMPHAIMAYQDNAYEIEKLGLLSDFDQYLTKKEIDQYIDEYIDEGKIDNKIKIFPIAKSTEILIVNKTDWDEFQRDTNANINDFETWEGISNLAKQYYGWSDSKTDAKNDGKAFFGRDAMANYMILGSKQLGEEIFKVNDGDSAVNINENVMRRLWDNFYVPYINGYYGAYGRFRSDDAKTGDIIALVGSTAGAEYFPTAVINNEEKSHEIESMILPIPNFKNQEGYMTQQGAGMVLIKSDFEHEYAITQFLKWFTETDRNIEFSIKSGYLPVKKEANNSELIQKTINETKDLQISEKSQKAILTAMNQEKKCKFYSSKVFSGGSKIRAILEKSMLDKAKLDREQIKIQLDNGIDKDTVIRQFDTDENFKNWLQELRNKISHV